MSRYIDNKCFQCWLCKNKGGSNQHGLPECKVENKYMYEVYEEPCPYFVPIERVKNLILSTADVVEVVHGKWIPRTNLPKQEIFICSVCDGWAYSPWIGNRKNPKPNWCKYKYCPNCGAKMEVIK